MVLLIVANTIFSILAMAASKKLQVSSCENIIAALSEGSPETRPETTDTLVQCIPAQGYERSGKTQGIVGIDRHQGRGPKPGVCA